MSEDRKPWHLDKKVPISLIAAIGFQTVGFVWWASTIDHQVKANRETNVVQDGRLSRLEDFRQSIGERLAKIEQLSLDIAQSLNRMDQKLDKIDRPPK